MTALELPDRDHDDGDDGATAGRDATDEALLLHHEYDGIREYDNPMPFWWKGLFALTIAYSVGYLYWYHGGGPGRSDHEVYAADLRELEAVRAGAAQEEVVLDEAALTALAKDPAVVATGQAVFVKHCVSCHADDGRGLVGPNLTDRFQIHGATRLDLHHTISAGVPEKGMLAWGAVLPPAEVNAATVWVIRLRGTDAPAGKAAEGRRVEIF